MTNENSTIGINLTPELVEEILKSYLTGNNEDDQLKSKILGLIQSNQSLDDLLSKKDIRSLMNEYDTKEVKTIKLKVKDTLEKDTVKALKYIKSRILDDCTLYDDITGLIARYHRIDKYLHKGTITYADAHLEFTKIDNSVIMIVNELDKEDLNK